MENERILREQIFGSVPNLVHTRLQSTLYSIEEEPMRKIKYQPIIVILIVFLLCSVAIATVSWDVRTALTRTDNEGNQTVNEEYLQLTQTVNKVFEGDILRMEVTDAVFDRRTLTVAWTITNKSSDLLIYLKLDPTENSIKWNDGPCSFNGEELFLKPGETANGMFSGHIYEDITGDTACVGIRYNVFTPSAEIAYIEYPQWDSTSELYTQSELMSERFSIFEKKVDELIKEGMLVISLYDEKEDSSSMMYQQGYETNEVGEQYELHENIGSYTEALVSTGKFAFLETVDAVFDLQITNEIRSILPDEQAAEKTYDDFILRILQAEVTPDTIEIIVELSFEDLQTAIDYTTSDRNHFGLTFLTINDKEEIKWWSDQSCGDLETEIEKKADGTWSKKYSISHSQIQQMPSEITICPVVFADFQGYVDATIDDLMEGITLTIKD